MTFHGHIVGLFQFGQCKKIAIIPSDVLISELLLGQYVGFIKGVSMGRLGYIKAFDRTHSCGTRRVVLQQPFPLPSVGKARTGS